MNTTPQLDARTKEIAMGVRNASAPASSLQRYLGQLRSILDGTVAYQDWLESQTAWSDYETNLDSRIGWHETDSADAGAARSLVEGHFGGWSSFKGDPGNDTGVYSTSDWVSYRTYLTDAGVPDADADEHLQTVRALFTYGDSFRVIVGDASSWSDLETRLSNRGYTDPANYVDALKDEFGTLSSLESALSQDPALDNILNQVSHDSTIGDAGGARIEIDGTELTIRASRIDLEKLQTEDGTDPDGSLSWSMTTGGQGMSVNDTLTVTATATSQTAGSWTTSTALRINGSVARTLTVQVVDGSASVSTTWSPDAPGAYGVAIGDSFPIPITVLPV